MRINRKGFALLAGGAAILVVGASAATLGGLTPSSLGANTTVVSGCQNGGLGVSWGTPAYSATGPTYTVNSGTITGIAAGCITSPAKQFRLDVSTGAASSLASATGSFPTSGAAPQSTAFTLSGAVDAQSITQVTLVVYG